MEHGLAHITFYVQKHDTFNGLFWSPAGSRQAARRARICEARLLIEGEISHAPERHRMSFK